MREYATPLTADVAAAVGLGNLTDDVVRNGDQHGDGIAFSRRVEGAWQDVTAAQFLGRGPGRGEGAGRGRHRGRRPRRPDLPHALRVDAARLRDLVRRRRHGADLRDLVAPSRSSGSSPTPAPARSWPRRPSTWPGSGSAATGSTSCTTCGRSRAAPSACSPGWAPTSPTTQLEARRTKAGPDSLATLIYTSGHHGPAEGLHAHPRQLPVRARRGHRRSSTSCSPRRRRRSGVPRRCCSCRWPTSSPGSSRSGASRRGCGWATPPTSRTCSTTSPRSSRRSSSRSPGSSRRCSTPPRSAPSPTVSGRIFNRAADVAIAWSRGLETGRTSCRSARSTAVFDRLVYARLRKALGGRCAYAISGGAPLGDRLGHFYRGIGVNVLEGYGLTETTAALTANLPDAQKVGTVGRPLQGTAVRVADGRRAAVPGRPGLRRLLAQRRGDRRGQGRPTAGSTPATSARSTTRASCGSPGARRRSW